MKRLSLLAVMVLVAGCPKDKNKGGDTGGSGANNGGTTAPTAAPLLPIGMTDPFARLGADSAKTLQSGYKALRAKKYDDAQAAFRAVSNSAPDYTAAGWALIRAEVLGGNFKDVPAAYEALLARDDLAYAGRMEKPKEFTAFRNAPEWTKVQELETRYREAYAKGLDRGFFFVARTHAAVEPKIDAASKEAPLDLKQEVFHYDVDAKRFRRLTETGGQAFALNRSADGKWLGFLMATRLHRENGVDSFVDPKVGGVELGTLTTIGPFTQRGRFDQVIVSANAAGEPVFTFLVSTGAAETYGFDTARSGLAKLSGDFVPTGGETRAWPGQVAHMTGKSPEGVKITDGANTFVIENGNLSVTAARAIAQSSLDWSPGKTRLTYAGRLDACKILKGGGADKNELYVYDLGKKTAQRIAAAVSAFETLWLDDDHLVYEGGVGKDGKIHLYAFVAHADSSLPTKNGAGLYGVPTLACEQAEPDGGEEVGGEEDGD